MGLDGFIRKIGIVSCVMGLRAIDTVLQADLFGFLPVEAQNALSTVGLTNAGFMEFFGIIDIMYECTSILKNMVIVGIPIPKGLQAKIAHWLENMTDETNVELKCGADPPGTAEISCLHRAARSSKKAAP